MDANRETFVSFAFSSANPYDVQAKLPWIYNFVFKSFINLKMIFLHPLFVSKGLTWSLNQPVACMMLMLDTLIYC